MYTAFSHVQEETAFSTLPMQAKRARSGINSPFAKFRFADVSPGFVDARGPPQLRVPGFMAKKYSFSGRVLGSGSFATVHEAVVHMTGERVAIKEIARDNCRNGKDTGSDEDDDEDDGDADDCEPFPPEDFVREVRALQVLYGTRGVVTVRESFVDTFTRRCWIVMDRMDNTLRDWFCASTAKQRNPVAWTVSHALARAVRKMHAIGVAHRDLKPCNVLINRNALARDGDDEGVHVRIGDFGLSRDMPRAVPFPATPRVVSLPYRAPELLIATLSCRQPPGDAPYIGPAVDVWSLACILYQIHVSGVDTLFPWEKERETLRGIVILLGCPPGLDNAQGKAPGKCVCEICLLRKKHGSLLNEKLAVTSEDLLARKKPLGRHCAKFGMPIAECLVKALSLDPATRSSAGDVEGFCKQHAPKEE